MKGKVYRQDEMEKVIKSFTPSDDTVIFRYVDFSKFMDIIIHNQLYYCRANKFEDKLEGMLPEKYYEFWPVDQRELAKNYVDAVNNTFPSFISCWNASNKESYALWKIYTNPNTGVCIKSTVANLRKAIMNEEHHIFKVKYVDYSNCNENISFPVIFDDANWQSVHHVYKNLEYQYEKEIRGILFHSNQEVGIKVNVDLQLLIDEVIVSPFAPKWFFELVNDVVSSYLGKTGIKVRTSSIELNGS